MFSTEQVSLEYLRNQMSRAGRHGLIISHMLPQADLDDRLARVMVHSVAHIFGHTHDDDEDEAAMLLHEEAMMKKIGLGDRFVMGNYEFQRYELQ